MSVAGAQRRSQLTCVLHSFRTSERVQAGLVCMKLSISWMATFNLACFLRAARSSCPCSPASRRYRRTAVIEARALLWAEPLGLVTRNPGSVWVMDPFVRRVFSGGAK